MNLRDSILNDEYGLIKLFLNSCFINIERLIYKIQEYIKFQNTSIETHTNNYIIIKLDFGDFNYKYKITIDHNGKWFCVKKIEPYDE